MQSLRWQEVMRLMTKRQEIEEVFQLDDLLFADGYDEAIIGIDNKGRIVYDASKVIDCLMKQGMDEDEAIDFYEFNIADAYVGENTPIFVTVF
jgi:hypothetical protein